MDKCPNCGYEESKPETNLGTFFWVCKECGKEFEFAISKLTHSPFGLSDCLLCNVKPGQRVPFQACPDCKKKLAENKGVKSA